MGAHVKLTYVGHYIPLSNYGPFTVVNIKSLCTTCRLSICLWFPGTSFLGLG